MYAQCVYICMYVWGGGGILCNFITCRFMEPLPSARRLLIKKSKASPGRLCNIVISLLSFWCCWTPFVPAFARNNFLKLSSECIFHPFTFNCLLLSAHFWSAGWVFPSGSFLDSFLKNAGSVCVLCSLSAIVFTTSLMILVPLFSSTFWENVSCLLSTSLIQFLLNQGCFVWFLMPIIILLLYF